METWIIGADRSLTNTVTYTLPAFASTTALDIMESAIDVP
jgi:hypothetical protein